MRHAAADALLRVAQNLKNSSCAASRVNKINESGKFYNFTDVFQSQLLKKQRSNTTQTPRAQIRLDSTQDRIPSKAPTNMSGKVPASPRVAPYFVHKRSISQSSDDVGGVLSEAEPEGIPGYLVSTPSETNVFVGIGSDNEVVDMLPSGANADEFGPRTVMQSIAETDEQSKDASATRDDDTNYTGPDAPVGSLLLQRKVPVKVDPKTFFANERTLLLWLHSALWLFAGASTILKYSNEDPFAQIYGIMLLPVALAFTTYALWQHARRVKMIRVKHPGPYEDLLGPALLGIALMTAIVAQFSLKLYSVWYY